MSDTSIVVPPPSGLARFAARARRQPALTIGIALLAAVAVVALAPGLFTGQSPLAVNVDQAMRPPSLSHLFGTDDTGRDILARVVFGTRITLSICLAALAAAAVAGGSCGLVSGFVGGRVDMLLGRIFDVVLSFPPVVLGIMVTGILGPRTANLVFALAVVYVPTFFRVARSGAMAEASLTYVEAARSVGLSETRILFGHVTRNVLPLILVQCMVLFPLVLQIQAALGFLGLGVQPPTPDWGAIMEQGKDYILVAPWISAFPGLGILVTALALMLVGKGLQRRLDKR